MHRQSLVRLAALLTLSALVACSGDGPGPVDPDTPPPPPPPNELPTAAFTASAEEGSSPFGVTFDAGTSSDPDGTIVSYSWTFGDGLAGSGSTVSHTFTQPGLFVVELTVRDSRDGEDSAKDTVFVASPPGAGTNSVNGVAWLDRNLNGMQDAGELGLHRIIVFLDDDGDGERDASEALVFTGEDGSYAFTGLDAGTTYRVTQELTLGWTNTTPGPPPPLAALGPGPARVINGEEANIADFPFQVALLQGNFQFCGGTLVGSQHVLTAAHCVINLVPSQVDILIGTEDLGGGGERVPTTAIRTHPNFSASLDYDVAVVRLDRPLLRPRVYLQSPDQPSLSEPGTIATVVGWGELEDGSQPTRLREVAIPIITNALCSDISGEIYGSIGPRTICAGGRDLGKGPCFGDSGGPLLVPSNDGWTQVGIVSFGVARDRCGNVPGAFSRVSELLDYITSAVRIEESGAYVVDWSSGPTVRADFGNFH